MAASHDQSQRSSETTSTATQSNLAASEQSQLQAQVVTGNRNTTVGAGATDVRGNNSGTILAPGSTQANVGGNVTVNSIDGETIAGAFGLTDSVVNQLASLLDSTNAQNVNLAEYATNQAATVADNANARNAQLADNANARVADVSANAQSGAYNLSGLAINQLADLAGQVVDKVSAGADANSELSAQLAAQAAKMAADNNVALSEAFQNFGNDLNATKQEALSGGQTENNKTMIYAMAIIAGILVIPQIFRGKSA